MSPNDFCNLIDCNFKFCLGSTSSVVSVPSKPAQAMQRQGRAAREGQFGQIKGREARVDSRKGSSEVDT